jgi:hypothetical protein
MCYLVDEKLRTLRGKWNVIEDFIGKHNVPYLAEPLKIVILEQIKNHRIEIITDLMNYNKDKKEVFLDKLELYLIYYDSVECIGKQCYDNVLRMSSRCV